MVEEYLKKLPPAPAGIAKWIYEEVVANTYIIYDAKAEKAACTRCGQIQQDFNEMNTAIHTMAQKDFDQSERMKGALKRIMSELIGRLE